MDTSTSVFFVDDDNNALSATRRLLRADHSLYRYFFFDEPLAAVEQLTRQRVAAVVVSDWQMPGMSGVDLVRALRDHESKYHAVRHYIMMLTSWSNPESVAEALNAGADDYLIKPSEREELLARINVGRRFIQLEARLRQANS